VQGLIEMPLLKKDKNIERSVRRAVSRPGGGVASYTGKYLRTAMQRYPKLRQKLQKSLIKNKAEILSFLQSEFRRKPSIALAKYLNEFYDKEREYIDRLGEPVLPMESFLDNLL
jgi:hypothetical protein